MRHFLFFYVFIKLYLSGLNGNIDPNKMRKLLILLGCTIIFTICEAQISAKLMKYVDISENQIAFVYGGDIWLVPKEGGLAVQITHSPGEESWPKFSPDGTHIAYTANYHGNEDVYLIPTKGGVPQRITYNSFADRMVEWQPNGKNLLIASKRESGINKLSKFFLVPIEGGLPAKLPIPYGELASYNMDGTKLAYITKITEDYPFKRYIGGLASDIILYDMAAGKTERVTTYEGNDGKPAWQGNKIYFLSDRGKNVRRNIWAYDTNAKELEQITTFDTFDISFLSAGPSDLVFEVGGSLYVMNPQTHEYDSIDIQVVSDLSLEIPQLKNVSNHIQNMTAAPGGKRVIFEARGELFDVPAKEGFVQNLTQSSGAYDHSPSWSPDGKYVAYWSDKGGEYEIYLHEYGAKKEDQLLSKREKGFGYDLHWSPDSKKIAFIDETNTIYIMERETGKTTEAGQTVWNIGHNRRYYYPISWSPDSRWMAFTQVVPNYQSAIFLYDSEKDTLHQATSGYYEDSAPTFSQDGQYLYLLTDRKLDALYSDFDNTWVYPNATQIGALALTDTTPSLLPTKTDELELEEDKKETEEDDKANEKKKSANKEKDEAASKEEEKKVEIDFQGLEARLTILPPKAGKIGAIMSFDKQLVYLRYPNSGSGEREAKLMSFTLEDREEKEVISDISAAVLTADGQSILVKSSGQYGIIEPKPGQKIDKPINTSDLNMQWIAKEEWTQIFHDTWRRHRDFFYDPAMHEVDWEGLRDQYGALVEDARTRWDILNIQANLVSELSAGHTYSNGGDLENVERRESGFLGIDWGIKDSLYYIQNIVKPAPWDTHVRSPFDLPGVQVKAGDYILYVNGTPLNIDKDPYAFLEGLAGKVVKLTVSPSGKMEDAKDIVITCLSQNEEYTLRNLAWIEANRQTVDSLSNGKLGYVYMSNTASQGQRELVRMYYGQLDKEGFIIDERFNGGGQLADRFLELMQRPVVYHLHWRHGIDHPQPLKVNTGPKGMLINGWAGSGGDGLPWAFQELKAGPIVGERTLGILVGPATGHRLIDGGRITVPGARLYDNDGHWFWEGEGVRPDIAVWDDPNELMEGRDPQLVRVVSEVLGLLEGSPSARREAPDPEDRSAAGLRARE